MDLQRFIKQHASTILSYVGATGVVITAIIVAKEVPKVLSLLEDAKEEKGEELTKWEKVKIAGPVYAPSIITGAATIACIFGSNIISTRKQASLVGAYALLEKSYKEYKKKTDEIYGEEAGMNIRSEIAKDKCIDNIELSDNDKELFYDFYSGRYFESTKEIIMLAQYETNRAMHINGAVCLNEYYELLGLEQKPEYENVGWACSKIEEMRRHPWIEFDYDKTIIDEESEEGQGLECTIVYFPIEPIMGYLD